MVQNFICSAESAHLCENFEAAHLKFITPSGHFNKQLSKQASKQASKDYPQLV